MVRLHERINLGGQVGGEAPFSAALNRGPSSFYSRSFSTGGGMRVASICGHTNL